MEKVRGDFQNLYCREDPHTPGLPLAIHVEPDKLNDRVPSKAEAEAEAEAAVRRICPHRAGRRTHLCAEHFKQWRSETYPGDQLNIPCGGSAGSVW